MMSVNPAPNAAVTSAAGANETKVPDSPAAGPAVKPECSRVLDDIWVFLDNEMDPVHRQQVKAHLDDCPPCLDESDIGEKLKALLHRKCGGEAAPEVLRLRLIQALQERR